MTFCERKDLPGELVRQSQKHLHPFLGGLMSIEFWHEADHHQTFL